MGIGLAALPIARPVLLHAINGSKVALVAEIPIHNQTTDSLLHWIRDWKRYRKAAMVVMGAGTKSLHA